MLPRTLAKSIRLGFGQKSIVMEHPNWEQRGNIAVDVNMIRKADEYHFILKRAKGCLEGPLFTGHEAEVCLQVIRSFGRKIKDDTSIGDIYFYAHYEEVWRRVRFEMFDQNEYEWHKVVTTALHSRAREVLGEPTVEYIEKALVDAPLVDDFKSDPFAYWWHAEEATEQAASKYEIELRAHANATTTSGAVEVADAGFTDVPAEKRVLVVVFAKRRKIFLQRLEAERALGTPIYQTPIMQARNRAGWISLLICVKKAS